MIQANLGTGPRDAYKGFSSDLTCRKMQYAIGEVFSVEGEISMCEYGIHSCECPLGCFAFYSPINSRYAEIRVLGEFEYEPRTCDEASWTSKLCAQEIKILREISVENMVNDAVHWMGVHLCSAQSRVVHTKDDALRYCVVEEPFSYWDGSADILIGTERWTCIRNPRDVAITMRPLSIAECTNRAETVALAFGSESAAITMGRCSFAKTYSSNSVAITYGASSALMVNGLSLGISKGAYSIAMSRCCSSKIILEGDYSMCRTAGSVIVKGKDCIIMVPERGAWASATITAVKGTILMVLLDPPQDGMTIFVKGRETRLLPLICGDEPDIWEPDKEVSISDIMTRWKEKYDRS